MEPPAFFFLFFFGMAILAVVAVVTARQAQRRRTAAFAAEAARLGLAFEEKSSEDLVRAFSSLAPFRAGQGSNKRAVNVLRGVYRGWDARFFDYMFVVSNGKSSTTVTFGVAFLRLGEWWPNLSAVPEGFGHKIWDTLGGDDLDFESAEFSRRFWVKAEERKFAYDVLHPRAMEHLLSVGWQRWHIVGDVVCLWHNRRPAVTDVKPALDALVDFVEMVPRFARPARPRVAVLANPDVKNNH